ncbi:hypothetical protein ACU8KH_01858 [Lachancea thermotolerans]
MTEFYEFSVSSTLFGYHDGLWSQGTEAATRGKNPTTPREELMFVVIYRNNMATIWPTEATRHLVFVYSL